MQKVKFGIKLPHSGPLASPKAISTIASEAEETGFDSIWVHDHISYGIDWIGHRASGLIDSISKSYEPDFYESICTLSYVSGITKHINLGTAVLILPLRNPLVLGRQLLTLQALSGHRLILGVASGDYPAEFRALGVPYDERGQITDEYLNILKLIFEGSRISYHGKYVDFNAADFYPRADPLPVIIGGGVIAVSEPHADKLAVAVLKRVARFGDGWMPDWGSPALISKGIEMIKSFSREFHRQSTNFEFGLSTALYMADSDEIAWEKTSKSLVGAESEANRVARIGTRTSSKTYAKSLIGSRATLARKIEDYSGAGINLFQMTCLGENLDSVLNMMKQFNRDVASNF